MTSIFYTRINLHLQKQIIHLWNMRGLVRSAIRIRNQAKWHQNQIKINQKLWSFSSVHRACSPQTWLNVSVHRLKHTDRGNAISRIVSYLHKASNWGIYDLWLLPPGAYNTLSLIHRIFPGWCMVERWNEKNQFLRYSPCRINNKLHTHTHTHIRWIWMSDEAVNIQMYVEKLLYL